MCVAAARNGYLKRVRLTTSGPLLHLPDVRPAPCSRAPRAQHHRAAGFLEEAVLAVAGARH